MVNGVIKYTTPHKVSMIHNMAKVDKFWPREKNEQMIEYLGLSKNSFKVIQESIYHYAFGLKFNPKANTMTCIIYIKCCIISIST
jgi:hypothetical protein